MLVLTQVDIVMEKTAANNTPTYRACMNSIKIREVFLGRPLNVTFSNLGKVIVSLSKRNKLGVVRNALVETVLTEDIHLAYCLPHEGAPVTATPMHSTRSLHPVI